MSACMENKNFNFYANLTPEQIFADLQTSEKGLSQQEAEKRLAVYGPNQIAEQATTWITLLKNQISNPFIVMFVIVAAIYFFTNQITEGVVLIIIMVINTCIGFYQEYQSSRAMALLKSYLHATNTVRRGGADLVVPINTLVPGDVIILKAVDIVPAD